MLLTFSATARVRFGGMVLQVPWTLAQTHLPAPGLPQTQRSSGAPLLRGQLLDFPNALLYPEAWDAGPGLEPENPAVPFAGPT